MTSQAHLVRTRIEAILATVTSPHALTVLTGAEDAITAAMLPAVRVLPGRVLRRQPNGGAHSLVTRTFRIVLYMTLTTDSKLAEQQTEITAAEDWLDVLPDVFLPLSNLQLAGAGLAFVTAVGDMLPGDEPVLLQYRNNAFSGIVNDLPVTYAR